MMSLAHFTVSGVATGELSYLALSTKTLKELGYPSLATPQSVLVGQLIPKP
ncbi:hypothetical protein [Nostoc sp. FACHB-110]|uniref:hypothetical protein n=1 Tax=Nostoc sp. FACHB-110 TaxID=2692834 RepID=UPI001A7EBB6F|nr:hypothetical protein [Nostoc sp. FACHB-110]